MLFEYLRRHRSDKIKKAVVFYLIFMILHIGSMLVRQSRILTPQNIVKENEAQMNSKNVINNEKFLKVIKLQDQRNKVVDDICKTRKQISGKMSEISGYKNGGISYCLIQKAGCTAWARIFRFLNGEKEIKKTPMDISKYETHNVRMKYFKFFKLKNAADKAFVESSTRVMTVRDPYSRLWSAYIDKFLLPDFWVTKGKEIIKKVRPNASIHALRCGYDVTFKEFITYIVNAKGRVVSWGQDKHWIPAASMCDPCVFKPKYIAKQETLSSDMSYILHHLDLDWVLNQTSDIDRTEYEMTDQTNYVFDIYKRHKACTTELKLCKLMWKAYQLNAYIPLDAPFPESQLQKPNRHTFLGLLNDARKNWNATKTEKRKIKRQAMIGAFKNIPLEMLKQLQSIYSDDFTLFEYESEPKDIFS